MTTSTMSRGGLGLALIALSVSAFTSCDNTHENFDQLVGNDPGVTGLTPPVPHEVRVEVGDLAITLTWTVDDASGVASYVVYRSEGGGPEEEIADGIADTRYVDTGVSNGVTYGYRVASVLTNGLIGDRSTRVAVTPGVYGVAINGGAAYANSRNVTLNLTAPAGTTGLRVGEDPDLGAEPWRAFTVTTAFQLAAGDGARTVYAQFRDAAGNVSTVFSDEITLDTIAEILSVDHSVTDGMADPGEAIDFRLETRETGGQATISIGTARTGIALFDDGAHGDDDPDDGVYATRFVVPVGLEAADADVIGRFTDAAGNRADDVSAPTTLTINAPPGAVVLASPFNVRETRLNLSWTQSPARDFSRYAVIRAEAPGAATDPDRMVVATITDVAETTFEDSGLEADTAYFYVVEVVDALGAATPSNEVSATTRGAPPAVTLVSPTDITAAEMTLSWARSDAADFAAYVLYRSEASSVDETDDRVARITDVDVLTATARELLDNQRYYFRVYVEDEGGATTGSNVVNGTTANAPPDPVDLTDQSATSVSVSLGWTQSDAHDFDRYDVLKAGEASPGTFTLLGSLTEPNQRTYTDFFSEPADTTVFFYKVTTFDTAGGSTDSNVVTVTVAPSP